MEEAQHKSKATELNVLFYLPYPSFKHEIYFFKFCTQFPIVYCLLLNQPGIQLQQFISLLDKLSPQSEWFFWDYIIFDIFFVDFRRFAAWNFKRGRKRTVQKWISRRTHFASDDFVCKGILTLLVISPREPFSWRQSCSVHLYCIFIQSTMNPMKKWSFSEATRPLNRWLDCKSAISSDLWEILCHWL